MPLLEYGYWATEAIGGLGFGKAGEEGSGAARLGKVAKGAATVRLLHTSLRSEGRFLGDQPEF